MKFSILLSVMPLLIIPFFASALGIDDAFGGLAITGSAAGAGNTDISVFVGNIIRALLGLLGILILVFILYGGYLWLVSGGNEQMVKKAKDILTSAFIGLIIVLAALAITTFIMEGITGAIRSSSDSSSSISCATGTNWACSLNDGTGSCSAQGPDCSCWCQ
ncbi:hypothetical protein EPN15_05605 [Patescibacteria group bacterium]|nr:MAG: hypothetical protein EPN15_05605 [Patescibacteria group bacterium]